MAMGKAGGVAGCWALLGIVLLIIMCLWTADDDKYTKDAYPYYKKFKETYDGMADKAADKSGQSMSMKNDEMDTMFEATKTLAGWGVYTDYGVKERNDNSDEFCKKDYDKDKKKFKEYYDGDGQNQLVALGFPWWDTLTMLFALSSAVILGVAIKQDKPVLMKVVVGLCILGALFSFIGMVFSFVSAAAWDGGYMSKTSTPAYPTWDKDEPPKCGCVEEEYKNDDCITTKEQCEDSYLKWGDDDWKKRFNGKGAKNMRDLSDFEKLQKTYLITMCEIMPSVAGRAIAAGLFHMFLFFIWVVALVLVMKKDPSLPQEGQPTVTQQVTSATSPA